MENAKSPANPHIIVTLNADDSDSYMIEWLNLQQLQRAGLEKTLAPGDCVVVTGSAHRDPEVKVMTLLTEIRRLGDGWSWSSTRVSPDACSADEA